ncbi:MAG: YihY/virulence factor BrkB family protein [Gaiellales bacterium]
MAATGHPFRHPLQAITAGTHPVLAKFLHDRGPHLAAMVAYYALLSLVPFLFLMVSLLGLVGPVSSGSYLIRELRHILPGQSADDLIRQVHTIQHNAGTLGAIGLIGLAWGTLGFYSALESAMNIVFGVSNRAFLHQKGVTFLLVLASLVGLFLTFIVATAATGWVDRHVHKLFALPAAGFAASVALTMLMSFVFLLAVYRYLTNVELRRGDVWPGAVAGAVLFELSFQALPLYLRYSGQLLALRAFGGLVILLVWLYLMANIIVLGAEINWWHWSRRQPPAEELSGLA